MCSCNLKTLGQSTYKIEDVFKDDALVKSISENKIVSKECFDQNHPLSKFQWLWCIAPEKMNDVLKPFNITVKDYKDIVSLYKMNELGLDKQKFNIDFLQLFDKIVLTNKEFSKTDCVIFCK